MSDVENFQVLVERAMAAGGRDRMRPVIEEELRFSAGWLSRPDRHGGIARRNHGGQTRVSGGLPRELNCPGALQTFFPRPGNDSPGCGIADRHLPQPLSKMHDTPGEILFHHAARQMHVIGNVVHAAPFPPA